MEKLVGQKYWLKLAKNWRKVKAPVRPSREDVLFFKEESKKIIGKKKNIKILIFGATPELRDLALSFKAEVVTIDQNLDMILAMKNLMKHKESNEVIIKGDWLSTPLKRNYFDLIWGDGVNTQFQWEKARFFYKHFYSLLKLNGYFVTRCFSLPDNVKVSDFTWKIIIDIFEKIGKNNKVSLQNLADLNICLQLLSLNKNEYVKSPTIRELNQAFKFYPSLSKKIKKKIAKEMTLLYLSKERKTWRTPTQKDTHKELENYFKIVKVVPSNYNYWKYVSKLFLLKK